MSCQDEDNSKNRDAGRARANQFKAARDHRRKMNAHEDDSNSKNRPPEEW